VVSAATALWACLALSTAASAQQDFSKVEIKTQKVAGNVHMLTGSGGNIGVSAGEDGLLIVDDQFAPLADKIRAALAEISKGDLAFVLNTHYHFDHTGGNVEFGDEATIVAHTNVRNRMSTEQNIRGNKQPPSPKVALPVITYDDSLSVHFNGEEIRVHYLPIGHTDGDSMVHFMGSNVVHMGDDFFSGRFPFVDLEGGGNAVSLAKNVGMVIAKLPADVQIIPGHGPLSTLDDLKLYHRMLESTIETVSKAKKSGKSLDEVKAAGFGDEWKGWGSGFINDATWAEIVYRSL
jgi:glyoxylase-like metal-dependent hydrolase (beta-lactamase superfamily II)